MVATGLPKTIFGGVFQGKRVLVTGHTGFKGFWLTAWLLELGARVTGCALKPSTQPNAFEICRMASRLNHHVLDVRSRNDVVALVKTVRPDIIFHMAAQAIVRESYGIPAETFDTNVTGTVNVLEAVRLAQRPCVVIVVTSDKCYLNSGGRHRFVENDSLGGNDPYSASKACAEIAVAAYRSSFFPPEERSTHGIAVASVRAGNVIGGGDWATDRLVPDIVRAITAGKTAIIRNPQAVRPWQFILDPLSGYLRLAALMYADVSRDYSGAYNFGPPDENAVTVAEIAGKIIAAWGKGAWKHENRHTTMKEADYLTLSWKKASHELNWRPLYGIDDAVHSTVEWYKNFYRKNDMFEFSRKQLVEYAAVSRKLRASWTSTT